tara:strand:- start:38 stop:394 length:357 start_codon:yes stop_codon:yes gene_type:complete
MSAKEIVENLLDENAYAAKEGIENLLFCKTADTLRDLTPASADRSFRVENAVPFLSEKEQSPEQKAYRALFDRILKKYGVDSPNDLEDSKKDDFFNEVEREWKKDPANDNEGEGEEND